MDRPTARRTRTHATASADVTGNRIAGPRERLGRLHDVSALDRPRPLPERVRPLARLLAPGRTVTWTSGRQTRAALAGAGAAAAATGTVVRLPRPPSTSPSDLGLLAHELTHVGDRGRRHAHADLFSLGSVGSVLDGGERRARQVGSAVSSAARTAERVPGGAADLPVGAAPAGMGRVMDVARQAATAALAAADRPSLPAGPAPGALADNGARSGVQRAADAVSSTLPRVPDAAPVTPSVVGDTASALLQTASVAGDRDSQMGEFLEALEERVLLEIERRGGRWAGVF